MNLSRRLCRTIASIYKALPKSSKKAVRARRRWNDLHSLTTRTAGLSVRHFNLNRKEKAAIVLKAFAGMCAVESGEGVGDGE